MLLCAGGALCARPAIAADALKFGAPPPWVRAQEIPAAKQTDAPISVLLNDQQVRLERGKVTAFSEAAMRIENAQGLAAGNVAVVWQPATDTITINKLQIRRGDKVIDVLANGQTFTVLRRETNLDAATLDGTLTATLQPEGLQVGDVIDLATTIEHSDPVLKGHVETLFGAWDGLPIQTAHASLQWPSDVHLQLRETPNLPAAEKSSSSRMSVLELSANDVQPLVPPKGAPERFKIGRLAEATDFSSWSDLASLFVPLFRDASAIPASGPLHDEVERIRSSSSDPKARATQALALVQDRVRYVALLMGQGGYVPAPAETTWSRRFGDCKGKTALLLGVLHSLGIQAEPVLVQSSLGDMIADRLPMIALFNHVLVRAHIGGKDYWLDGTRTGDTDLDSIEVPDFGWGLPLVSDAKLVQMVPAARRQPDQERHVEIDATGGIFAPASVGLSETYRGDAAVELNNLYAALGAAQRDEALRKKANEYFDGFEVSSTSLQFDKTKRVYAILIKGAAKLNWNNSWFYVPISSIAFTPDFQRPAGPLHDAPIAVSHPRFAKDITTIKLPPGFAAQQKSEPAVHETLAGVEYARSETVNGDTLIVESSERSIVPEVPYKQALADAPRLKALDRDDVYLNVAARYVPTDADLAELKKATPASANEYFVRAGAFLAHNQADAAITDLTAGLTLEPKSSWALRKRAYAYIDKRRLAEAEKDLQAANAIEPGSSETTAAWGDLASARGNAAEALTFYDKAIEHDPKNGWARQKRAGVLLYLGKMDEALRELTTVLVSDPHNASALAQRAYILVYREDWAGAEKDLAEALTLKPGDPTALATKAMIAVERKDFPAATAFVAQALASDPNNSYARRLQAQLAKREGNQTAVMQALSKAVADAPKDSAPLINRAAAHLQSREYDAADQDISAALSLDPGNAEALNTRADIARARGNFAGAVDALTAALAAHPGNGPVLATRAEAYRQMSKFDEALADTDSALKTGLISPSIRLLRINILIQKGDPLAVATEAAQLVSENPSSDFALVAAGKTYAALGMRDKAMSSFDRALALKPYAYIYINRSQVRPESDLQGKLQDLDAAIKLEPNQEDALAEKARLLSKAGKHAEAIDLYDRAIKSALDGTYLELGRAIALQRADRTAEAKAAFDSMRAKAKSAGDFNRMCWAKAVNDVLLQSALEDCRQGQRMNPDYPGLNASLGMVLLKLGKLAEARAAFDKAVAAKSDDDAYMGRAIVRSRMGDAAGARADAAEARRRRADVDDTFAGYGLRLEGGSTASSASH